MIDRSIQYNSRKDHLQMDTSFIKGVVVPILTICDKDEKIDEAKQRAQVDYVIKGGVTGILAFGSNGEFYMLEEDEMERGLKIMVDQAAGRVPVYFGIGAISTKKSCRLAKMAVKNGAAAVSVLQPMFLKPTYDELYNHFKTIAESVPETPMLLYNNPGRVGYTLSAKLVEELAHNVPNIIGMKDTSGDITQTSEFIRRTRDVDFKVFGGKDTLLYASLCHGAVGGVYRSQLHAGADHGRVQQVCRRGSGRQPGSPVQTEPRPSVDGCGQLPGGCKGYGQSARK